jgi:hypothetical protein
MRAHFLKELIPAELGCVCRDLLGIDFDIGKASDR